MLPMKTKNRKLKLVVEGDPDSAMRVGMVVKLIPVVGEGGVVAYNVVDDATGEPVMTVAASAVTASPDPDDDDMVQVGDSADSLTEEEELILLRDLIEAGLLTP
jgi:hypothetical protein